MHAQTSRTLRVVAATLLALPLFFAALPTGSAATTRVLAITGGTAHPQVPFSGFDGNPPKVYDINGDGQLEIIAQNDNNWVYVFDSRTGAILFEAKTTFPAGWGARTFNGPEVSILVLGGQVHLIVANSAAYITDYRFDSVGTNGKYSFTKVWERRLNDCFSGPGSDSKPVLADLDLDGHMEIIASTEELGVYVLRDTGAIMWKRCIGGGNGEPTVGDLNRDGWPEVVFGSDGGIVTAFNGRTGSTLWSFNALSTFNLGSGSIPVGVAIGQLDGLDGNEVVFGARDSHDANNWSNDHALLAVLNSNGGLVWGRQDPTGNPLTYTRPIIGDAAGDGQAEIYWGDWNTIGHKPPWNEADAWKVTGPAHFYRYDPSGNMVWRQSLGTWWSNKDVPIADVDGDGVQEMLANGPGTNGRDGIWYLDTRTGAKETFIDTWPWQVARAPVLADLWNSGTMQWVVEVGPSDPSAGGPGILVYDTHVPYSSLWPHLPYPTVGPAPTTTTPPAGTFGATFTIKAPNEWWQELYVQPDTPRTITSAEVQVNDGGWDPMTKSSWGAWTSSYHTVAGSKVEFRATDSAGATSTSEAFTWMDGTLSKRSVGGTTTTTPPPTTSTTGSSVPPTTTPTTSTTPPPTTTSTTTPPPTSTTPPPTTTTPPPTQFTATYRLGTGVNEWWVEVFVDNPSQPLSDVHARVNNGNWTALTLRDWGAWAKSMNAPRGSLVQFRATSVLGAQNFSQTYAWLVDPNASFTATFQPQAVGNDWWVEVAVTANHPLAKVEASVNDGQWIALELKSWGNWAKSFFVANGSSVKFRATDTSGNSVTSSAVIWT